MVELAQTLDKVHIRVNVHRATQELIVKSKLKIVLPIRALTMQHVSIRLMVINVNAIMDGRESIVKHKL